ncbi:DnaD domain protein [Clostridium botulinum]|uniref:phage replisome organizer N-terminal domain-containing protein n=1 Tax=Clostridium botulinum TaxID=1491 RepID=UPI000585ED04|nr:phage replisome organizer N-terminal domain-containing protein [Clostridium botulinum]AJD26583.1 DnaD domain protein [Clostridium botulinum CDC_297]APU61233.1 DnaD domain protein [Clostridium botulinum]MBY6877713.1 phage replisome organizer N-terminal domain-containing protein [Clostridium botulinum]MBY6892010.1 phage replisome organizer N-terminal domain-containing protein [Clostridium botulinum]MBY6894444.1 phage replisome organizer N-terminal domain-containing protein [Clostridium botuli
MAEVKWIKITTNMFDDEKIKLIDAMPERDTIHYIWIRLLVQAGKTNANGYIFLNENVPYTEEMLSTIFNRPLNSVRLALKTLMDFGMIEIQEDKLIKITNWSKHQNIEGMEKVREQNRLRKQKQRAKEKKLLQAAKDETCGVKMDSHSMSRDSHAIEEEVEVDIEEDIDIDIDKEVVEESKITTAEAKKFLDVINVFENNVHPITPIELEKLQDWSQDVSNEVIIMAIEEAVEYNARTMKYINKILNNWFSKGLKTLKAVNAYKRDWADKKKGVKSNGSSKGDNQKPEDEGIGFTV